MRNLSLSCVMFVYLQLTNLLVQIGPILQTQSHLDYGTFNVLALKIIIYSRYSSEVHVAIE